MKSILFFIRSLNAGGAERQLVVTAKGLAERGHTVSVLTFYSGGFYEEELAGSSVQLISLNKKGRWDLLAFFYRLLKVLRQQRPQVMYSFLNTANILAAIYRPFLSSCRIVWGVRASNMDLEQYDWLSRWLYWVECRLARFADVIIANSHAGLEYAVQHGFPKQKMTVIPNGIDTERFYPDKSKGEPLRKLWGIANDAFLIGVVGRIDPMKGIPTFLEAAAKLKQQHANVRFVWVGDGESRYKSAMLDLAIKLGMDDIVWAGRHANMLAVYNAFDIASSSSSYGEGFPNVLGEAMACGVPCVVTDVGDSALLVGKTGKVVSAKDSEALALAWSDMLLLDRSIFEERTIAARKRVVNEFGVGVLIEHTEEVLLEGIIT